MPAVMQIIEHTNRDCQEGKLAGREVVYSSVAARRQQWDNLVWQVPVLSLTAQAFLFTIAIGGDSQRIARVIASLLSLVVTFLCMTLMARHRQAEIMDAHWLEDFEKAEWPSDAPVHGYSFQASRNAAGVDGGWTEALVPTLPGYKTWIAGLYLFAIAAAAVLAIAIFSPDLLSS